MKHLIVLATLACALSSQTASAEEHARPILEIRYGSEIAAPTKTVLVWGAGAYTVKSYDADGVLTNTLRTGFDNTEMAQVRTALRVAPWTITYSKIVCFAYSPSFTEYYVRGKLVYRAQMCSGAMADDVSLQSIATIEKLIAAN